MFLSFCLQFPFVSPPKLSSLSLIVVNPYFTFVLWYFVKYSFYIYYFISHTWEISNPLPILYKFLNASKPVSEIS